jgi:hypothetical protein
MIKLVVLPKWGQGFCLIIGLIFIFGGFILHEVFLAEIIAIAAGVVLISACIISVRNRLDMENRSRLLLKVPLRYDQKFM